MTYKFNNNKIYKFNNFWLTNNYKKIKMFFKIIMIIYNKSKIIKQINKDNFQVNIVILQHMKTK